MPYRLYSASRPNNPPNGIFRLHQLFLMQLKRNKQ